jgi:DNA-binding transcriptional ArsR family regulator
VTDDRRTRPEDHWDEVSFVIRSKYRVTVLEQLNDGPATPSRIASYSNFSLSHVSRALQELRDRGLVELLVSEQQRMGRLYGPTLRADEVWNTIEAEHLA